MAFDTTTRNRLASFVAAARGLIADEFTEQFQSLYGIAATGDIAPLDRLSHLDEEDLGIAARLRERIDYLIKNHPHDKEGAKVAVARLAREQAFTVLNRIAAVRMAEKRGIIVESVGQSYQSKGFKVFETVAGSALGDTYHRYRCYLFCLFDELAIDLGILFDRRSPHALLFPREPALLALLNLLNAHELQDLWAEDETIGWIYQYYNDEAERKKMRDPKSGGSAAPRNSYELAVRNQFFTPRYVVEFLTDNTLGRLWYEMTKGQTALKDQCRYLVRRPNEVFLRSLHDAYRAVYGRDVVIPKDLDSTDAFAALYRGDMQPAAKGEPGFFALAGGALSEQSFRTATGESWEQHGNECIEELTQAILGERDHPKKKDIVWGWAAISQHLENSQIGSPYAHDSTRKLEAYFRGLLLSSSRSDEMSQEELIRQPVLIPHRPLKDPREIRLLDPACGSMHFGLYAFDLFTVIYDEAWEIAHGPDDTAKSAESFALFVAFAATFPDKAAFLREVPRLIVERNIHGIDIDPRAAQIAGLSLWLRAQRAWHQAGVKPADRPRITRSNVVCAEPMPGEKELLREFVEQQFPAGERPAFAFLLETIFDRMFLAGEAGSLLRIEEEIRIAIADAKRLWKQGPRHEQASLFDEPGEKAGQGEMRLDLSGITDEQFWERAEQRIYAALEAYAEQAENGGGFQRRLFADDAAQGFAFIDLCRKRYDVVVMNPPFGSPTENKSIEKYLKDQFKGYGKNLACAMVLRGIEFIEATGRIGVIADRSLFFRKKYSTVRRRILDEGAFTFCDLGWGVLDAANVEVSSIALGKSSASASVFFDARFEANKSHCLEDGIESLSHTNRASKAILHFNSEFSAFPNSSFVYWVPKSVLTLFQSNVTFGEQVASTKQGTAPADTPRFVRLFWEIPPDALQSQTFARLAHGGPFSPYFRDYYFVIQWQNIGELLKVYVCERYPYLDGNPAWVVKNEKDYMRRGVHFGKRCNALNVQLMPPGMVFTNEGHAVFPHTASHELLVCGLLNTRIYRYIVNTYCGQHKHGGYIDSLPSFKLPLQLQTKLENYVINEWKNRCRRHHLVETSNWFTSVCLQTTAGVGIQETAGKLYIDDIERDAEGLRCRLILEDELAAAANVTRDDWNQIQAAFGADPTSHTPSNPTEEEEGEESGDAAETDEEAADAPQFSNEQYGLAYALSCRLQVSVEKLLAEINTIEVDPIVLQEHVRQLVSYIFGSLFGRWDIRYATGERPAPELPDPFSSLPVCPPGMLQGGDGLPAEPKDLPADYPLRISWPGILVDDENHLNKDGISDDIVVRFEDALKVIWKDHWEAIEQEACGILGVKTLRDYFRRPTAFFADHLKRYSKSRRQAPIYWPLSTKSGSYTMWLYYHRLTDQTLHTCLADFLDPKLHKVQSELDALTGSGGGGTRASELRDFLDELKDLRDEIERVIKLPWKPNLNDGVLITASPLHKLFRLPKWHADLKACWDKLAKGDYDWAHLAHTIWPKRVEKACEKDRSIAIAHGLEHLCKVEPPKPKKKRGKKTTEDEESDEDESKLIEED